MKKNPTNQTIMTGWVLLAFGAFFGLGMYMATKEFGVEEYRLNRIRGVASNLNYYETETKEKGQRRSIEVEFTLEGSQKRFFVDYYAFPEWEPFEKMYNHLNAKGEVEILWREAPFYRQKKSGFAEVCAIRSDETQFLTLEQWREQFRSIIYITAAGCVIGLLVGGGMMIKGSGS